MDIPWPAADLREVIEVALERGGHLLTAGEGVVVRRLLALDDGAASLYARLSTRVGPAFVLEELDYPDVPDVRAAVEALCAAQLASTVVPAEHAGRSLTVAQLKQCCRQLGQPVSGRKEQLVERLAPFRGWWPPLVQLRHLGLLRRLEQWRFLRSRPDRSTLVAERLGHLRWPAYPVTTGPRLFADRRALLRWEAVLAGLGTDAPEAWLAALDQQDDWPAPLDLSRRLARRIRHAARALEQAGELSTALALLEGLGERGVPPWRLAVRHSRVLERLGRQAEALAVLRDAAPPPDSPAQVAIERSGRRLARSLRRGWAPSPPRAAAPERRLQVALTGRDRTRPTFASADGEGTAERVVITQLEALGRQALHVEGALWRTLFALVFAPAFFAPVPGALPSRFLDGPLDLGTARFAARRPEEIASCWAGLERGAGEWVLAAHERWSGSHLAGASWSVAPVEVLVTVAESLGAGGLRALLEPLLLEGPRAARGLPDLVVLPGEPVRVPGAFPSRLSAELALVEVKGPTDQLQDAQHAWHHRLVRAGVAVEVWHLVS